MAFEGPLKGFQKGEADLPRAVPAGGWQAGGHRGPGAAGRLDGRLRAQALGDHGERALPEQAATGEAAHGGGGGRGGAGAGGEEELGRAEESGEAAD